MGERDPLPFNCLCRTCQGWRKLSLVIECGHRDQAFLDRANQKIHQLGAELWIDLDKLGIPGPSVAAGGSGKGGVKETPGQAAKTTKEAAAEAQAGKDLEEAKEGIPVKKEDETKEPSDEEEAKKRKAPSDERGDKRPSEEKESPKVENRKSRKSEKDKKRKRERSKSPKKSQVREESPKLVRTEEPASSRPKAGPSSAEGLGKKKDRRAERIGSTRTPEEGRSSKKKEKERTGRKARSPDRPSPPPGIWNLTPRPPDHPPPRRPYVHPTSKARPSRPRRFREKVNKGRNRRARNEDIHHYGQDSGRKREREESWTHAKKARRRWW